MRPESPVPALNAEAIKEGLLLPHGQSERKDFSPLLGRPLSWQEERFYMFIVEKTKNGGLASVEDIFKALFFRATDYRLTECDRRLIWQSAVRIRDKLGETELICWRRKGYQSRRALNSLVSSGRIELPFRV